jgi:7,8-dihydropterin-6-yl-methyl-4-(beta-D-ribofuranosyl)aminobenzene 5'-phosphate synthase
MFHLNEINKIEIFVLVDNISDPFTQNDQGIYWNESQYRHGIRKHNTMCGADYCRACNGMSLLIQIKTHDQTSTLLFDTGPDAGLAVDNAKKLGVDLTQVDAIVLSHGHFDHYGGTISVLDAIGKHNLPVYVHPELFLPRAFGYDERVYVSDILTAAEIEKHGGRVVSSDQPISILDGIALISGEVPRTTSYEKGMPHEYKLKNENWECEPEVIDERCVIFNFKNKGLCVITGCGHTGIVNATLHSMQLLNSTNVHFVMGGFHLAGAKFQNRIDPTINDLKQINPDFIITGHCTGRKTQASLSEVFDNRHIPYGVGAYFKFE